MNPPVHDYGPNTYGSADEEECHQNHKQELRSYVSRILSFNLAYQQKRVDAHKATDPSQKEAEKACQDAHTEAKEGETCMHRGCLKVCPSVVDTVSILRRQADRRNEQKLRYELARNERNEIEERKEPRTEGEKSELENSNERRFAFSKLSLAYQGNDQEEGNDETQAACHPTCSLSYRSRFNKSWHLNSVPEWPFPFSSITTAIMVIKPRGLFSPLKIDVFFFGRKRVQKTVSADLKDNTKSVLKIFRWTIHHRRTLK